MINTLIALLERIKPEPKVWLIMYCPVQGQFTHNRSDMESKVNSRLLEEGRFDEMSRGVLAGYADTEIEAANMIPVIAKKLGLRWSEKDCRWFAE